MDINRGFTNKEQFMLPSKGKVYSKPVNPLIELRSMTTEDEALRTSPSKLPQKTICDMIEGCMVEKPAIHVYDMCEGDVTYLLHKLRTVTYGPEYKMEVMCPNCRETHVITANLDDISVNEYDESIEALRTITLPKSGKKIGLRMMTPRDRDEIQLRADEVRRKSGSVVDRTFVYELQHQIESVDGVACSELEAERMVAQMPMADANYLYQKAAEYNRKVGLDTEIVVKCGKCGFEFVTSFRYGKEFFRPTVD